MAETVCVRVPARVHVWGMCVRVCRGGGRVRVCAGVGGMCVCMCVCAWAWGVVRTAVHHFFQQANQGSRELDQPVSSRPASLLLGGAWCCSHTCIQTCVAGHLQQVFPNCRWAAGCPGTWHV